MVNESDTKSVLKGNIFILGITYANKFNEGDGRQVFCFPYLNYSFLFKRLLLISSFLFFTGLQLSAQTKFDKSENQTINSKEKKSLPGLEAAKIPSGITFSSELEKVYGDANYELGQQFDMNGMLINYSAEDTTILKIEGNVAMILKVGETKVFAEISEFQNSSNSVPLVQHLKVQPGTLKLTVLPDQIKVFGDLDPDFRFETSGLVYGEGLEVFSGSLAREAGENTGMYRISLGDLKAGGNYQVEFSSADFEIIPREVLVEARDAKKFFGADDPEFSYLIEGVDGQDLAQIISGQVKRKAGESVGKYTIEVGDMKVAANYKLTFQEGVFEISPTELSAIFDLEEIETSWSKMPDLPVHISAITLDGQILNLPVNWSKNDLDLLKNGTCSIIGILQLPDGILNPLLIKPVQKLTVLPKPSPEDVLLSSMKFEPISSSFTVEIGQFTVVDKFDDIHSISLVNGGLDNSQFEVNGAALSWKNAPNQRVKNQYSILVSVLDRAGNSLEKEFQLSAEFTQISKIHIYNVFTPNNDGFNDTWGIPSAAEIEGIQIRVFSKNGNLLFETENPEKQWDGTSSGKSVPVDTYFWVLSAKRTGETRKGFLTLLR